MNIVEVLLPQEGMAMQAATVAAWLKQVGDVVEKGEVIAEVDAEKASFDITSPADGIIEMIKVPVGVEVPVRTVLAIINVAER
jgi:pyruvate/2-oxoglutarate dehydrogenase complex dihydrolipoamide acyltransferase (E2) component